LPPIPAHTNKKHLKKNSFVVNLHLLAHETGVIKKISIVPENPNFYAVGREIVDSLETALYCALKLEIMQLQTIVQTMCKELQCEPNELFQKIQQIKNHLNNLQKK
jgi:hypothetical protein